jgi:hypothetical protein
VSACLPVVQIFVSFSYPVSLTSFPSACLIVCRSNICLLQLSGQPNFLSQCLLACMLFIYTFVSVILSPYLPFPVSAVSACLPVVRIFVSFSYPLCLSSFSSVCLLACRSNIRFVQLSCLPIFPPSACLPVSVSQSACLSSSNVHIHMSYIYNSFPVCTSIIWSNDVIVAITVKIP